MTDDEIDAFMDAGATALGLHIDPAWRDAVRANLTVTFRLGGMVLDFDPPGGHGDPAPVFEA